MAGVLLYTRRGDSGETSLYGPRRVPKDSLRVEAYGTIDELNSVIGLVIAESKDKVVVSQLKEVQRLLFVAGADAASEPGTGKIPRIRKQDITRIEELTDASLSKLPTLRNFILPGGTPTAARLQLARAVCRRAERRLVAASKTEDLNQQLIPFFNRLSSYLFNLARLANKRARKSEETWKP